MTFLDIFLNHLPIFKLSFNCFYIFQLQFGYFTSFLVCFVSLIEVDSLYYNYVSAFQLLLPFFREPSKAAPAMSTLFKRLCETSRSVYYLQSHKCNLIQNKSKAKPVSADN